MKYLGRRVKDINISNNSNIDDIFNQMSNSGGFVSRHMSDGLHILCDMINDKQCFKFISFVGAVISTGLRGIIKDMIKMKMFDAVITTCGALDHDIARTYANYYEGDFRLNDVNLASSKIHRLGNVLIPTANYGPLIENKMQKFLTDIYKDGMKEIATYELCDMLGRTLKSSSFLYWASKNNIPVFVPGIMDGAVGSQTWLFSQTHRDFKINLAKDSDRLSEIVFSVKRSGALMIGGGISKHHTLWWNQFRNGLDYAVYITTAPEYDGSLSGALVREAISWGKVKRRAKQTTIHGEATTLIPFLFSAIRKKVDSQV
ncbi:MAG: deoxyhypusine synthase [Thaumarchaeota archaeon]|nr:deoxyhypusine synthase [Nitrososphaerota archaeon]